MELIRGRELAVKILQQITEQPESHDQNVWATSGNSECGTVACIAGWAVEFNRNRGERDQEALDRLASDLDTPPWFDTIGRELLRLTPNQAGRLFYTSGAQLARERLAELFDLPVPE